MPTQRAARSRMSTAIPLLLYILVTPQAMAGVTR